MTVQLSGSFKIASHYYCKGTRVEMFNERFNSIFSWVRERSCIFKDTEGTFVSECVTTVATERNIDLKDISHTYFLAQNLGRLC